MEFGKRTRMLLQFTGVAIGKAGYFGVFDVRNFKIFFRIPNITENGWIRSAVDLEL